MFPSKAHNLLSVRNMQHQPIEQVATEATHQGLSFLGAGRTMLRFHGAGENSRHCDNSDDRAERLHTKDYTKYQLYVIHPSKEGIDKNIHSDTVSRIMEYEMIPDTLPHPTRSSITTLRTSLGAGSDPSQGRPATHRHRRNSSGDRQLSLWAKRPKT